MSQLSAYAIGVPPISTDFHSTHWESHLLSLIPLALQFWNVYPVEPHISCSRLNNATYATLLRPVIPDNAWILRGDRGCWHGVS